jgi:hypothetical protein
MFDLTSIITKPNPSKPEVDINEDEFIYSDYKCPKCGEYPPEWPYKTRHLKLPKGVYMPIIKNKVYTANSLGHGWDWDEFHVCKHCKTKYYFSNSSC